MNRNRFEITLLNHKNLILKKGNTSVTFRHSKTKGTYYTVTETPNDYEVKGLTNDEMWATYVNCIRKGYNF